MNLKVKGTDSWVRGVNRQYLSAGRVLGVPEGMMGWLRCWGRCLWMTVYGQ